MTNQQLSDLGLGVNVSDYSRLLVESAFLWINDNTTLNYDVESLSSDVPSNVKLFVIKYVDLMSTRAGVTSESAEGLSQSFGTESKDTLLWQYAEELLGAYCKTRVKTFQFPSKWC